jgi:hypothetical protein
MVVTISSPGPVANVARRAAWRCSIGFPRRITFIARLHWAFLSMEKNMAYAFVQCLDVPSELPILQPPGYLPC